MLKAYPPVRSEEETLRRVLAGASLARYGDGEFKHCDNQRNVSQAQDPRLSARLREILVDSGSCMVGIPNLHAADRMTPEKAAFWRKYGYAAKWLEPRPYASAFISRPDSAPWINTPEYWAQLESLWFGQDVTLVRGSAKGLTREDLAGARHVSEIISQRQHAFADYDALLERIGKPSRAILCLGPTATVLAVDLCARGVHAIDLGHVALFLRKYRRGEPMWLSKDDKSHDKLAATA
jgi:glycosyltransferase GT-like protein